MDSILLPSEVRLYIKDFAEDNRLLDGEEFTDSEIKLGMDLAIGEYNMIPPATSVNRVMFPNKALLMSGTLYKLFSGRAALLSRNTMSYSDGGIQVPVEERAQLYVSLAAMYQADFFSGAQRLKTAMNLEENGWGGVRSDYSAFPMY